MGQWPEFLSSNYEVPSSIPDLVEIFLRNIPTAIMTRVVSKTNTFLYHHPHPRDNVT